jgi:hypothetical protein
VPQDPADARSAGRRRGARDFARPTGKGATATRSGAPTKPIYFLTFYRSTNTRFTNIFPSIMQRTRYTPLIELCPPFDALVNCSGCQPLS